MRNKFLRMLPSVDKLSNSRKFSFLGSRIKDPTLWHFHRRSVAMAFAIGVFCAYLPMPMETIIAVALSIYIGANIPIAFVTVFISNPLTWAFLYTPAYKLGALITQPDSIKLSDLLNMSHSEMLMLFDFSKNHLGYHYLTLWIGCLILGSILSIIVYYLCLWAWEFHIILRWKERNDSRSKSKYINKSNYKNKSN